MQNPYTNTGGIEDPEYFCGREEEIKSIYSNLCKPTPIYISVIGERRMGKTSLLAYIANPSVISSNIEKYNRDYNLDLDPKKFIFVNVDLQLAGAMSEYEFWRFILDETLENVKDATLKEEVKQVLSKDDIKIIDVSKLGKKIRRSGYKLIYLFDEFESLIGNENMDISFYSGLRSLIKVLSLITSTKKSLYELTIPKEKLKKYLSTSEFFNIFAVPYIKLDLFNESDVCKLMGLADKFADVSLEDDKDFILRIAGYHPFFTTVLCNYLLNMRRKKDFLKNKDYEEIKANFLKGIESHYLYIWNQLEDEEKEFVQNELSISKQESKDNRGIKKLVESLKEKKVVIEKDDRVEIFSEMFSEFVTSQPELEHQSIQNLSDREVAEEIRDRITELKGYINKISDKTQLQDLCKSCEELKNKLQEDQNNLATSIRNLKRIDKEDIYRTEPAFANQRRREIEIIEGIKNALDTSTINRFYSLKSSIKNELKRC
jgi:hypothetical protein